MAETLQVRWRHRRTASIWLMVGGVLFAVMGAIAMRWKDGPGWLLIVLGIAAVAGGGVLQWHKEKAGIRDEQDERLTASSGVSLSHTGGLRTVAETGREEFRVHRASVQLDYCQRDLHQDVLNRLIEGRPVLVVGHSLAGKTRMASEVVREQYSDWPIWIPERPDGLGQLLPHGVPQATVVWLDDLEAYLTAKDHLRLAWLEMLLAADCRVVATIRASEYEKFQPTGEVKPPQWEVLQRFARVWMYDNPDEQNRIAASIEDPVLAKGVREYGLAEYLGGAHLAIDRYNTGRTEHPLAIAMLQAAADWRRLGFLVIPQPIMVDLAMTYLPGKLRNNPGEDEATALEWACTEIGGRLQLLESAENGWRVFDYLLDHLTEEGAPIPDQTWVAALLQADHPLQALVLGNQAYRLGRFDRAIEAYRQAMDSGDAEYAPMAAVILGMRLKESGDLDGAAEAYQQAINSGHAYHAPRAALIRGALLRERGDFEGAAETYRRGIALGDTESGSVALVALALTLESSGDLDDAAEAYRQAIDLGHADYAPMAAVGLGTVLRKQGDLDNAVMAFQQAIDSGHNDHALMATIALGLLFEARGDLDGAEEAYRKALASGHADHTSGAALALGLLLQNRGDLDGAIVAFRQAIDSAHGERALRATLALGQLLHDRGDLDGAAEAFQHAKDLGATVDKDSG